MILMRVLALMGEHDIRIDLLLDLFESGFHFGANERHKAVGEFFEHESLEAIGAGKRFRGSLRLRFANSHGVEDNPVKRAVGILIDEAEDGAAATNLNVVGMGTETQNLEGPVLFCVQA
jgi:hypothetical protein